jgi:hypothetical protein
VSCNVTLEKSLRRNVSVASLEKAVPIQPGNRRVHTVRLGEQITQQNESYVADTNARPEIEDRAFHLGLVYQLCYKEGYRI